MGLLDALLAPKLPRDRITRLAGRHRRATRAQAAEIQAKLDAIAALPGLADVGKTKRLPKGLTALLGDLLRAYDAYAAALRARLALDRAPRPGEPGGVAACYVAPMGVTSLEAIAIYRQLRERRDFPELAQRLAEAAQRQLEDIQSRHTGKDPERIPMTSKALREGRLAFARRGQPCPLLDPATKRCSVWEVRPLTCRGHHIVGDPALANPSHPKYLDSQAINLRLPLRAQVAVGQIEKRLGLQINPFLFAGQLQLLQLVGGEALLEVGEAPRPMALDGRVAPKANRNVKHAKKFKKKPKR